MKTLEKWNNSSINVKILALHNLGEPVSLADRYFYQLPTNVRRKLIITTLKHIEMTEYKKNIQCPHCSFQQSNLSYNNNKKDIMTCQKCGKEFKVEIKTGYKTCKIESDENSISKTK